MFDLNNIVRENIKKLNPYSTARDEFKGVASVYLDANESPFDNGLNRYPDPLQQKLKAKLSVIKAVDPPNMFLGNGSDEAIDLLIRAFCEPAKDNIVAIKPTYGMYKVCAGINNVEYREVLLNSRFELDSNTLLQQVDKNTKLIFLCSPNNPTGNSLNRSEILFILQHFEGIVVIDEAYIDFSCEKSFTAELQEYNNLVVLQTFSKAWGMAGVRLGMAFADMSVITILNKIKYPYNINILTQQAALEKLSDYEKTQKNIEIIIQERNALVEALKHVETILYVYPTDSNFVLVKVENAQHLYDYLLKKEIIVRDRSKVALCGNSLRITVGTPEENNKLIFALKEYSF